MSASTVRSGSLHRAAARLRALGALVAVVAPVVLVASVAACSVAATSSPSGALAIGDPWVRMPARMDQPTAAYLTIANPGGAADALLSASSPGAASVELHETALASDGMMGMRPVSRVDVPAGGAVALAPGGYHLMIGGLKTELRPGDRLELDLVFEKAGTVVVQAEVRSG